MRIESKVSQVGEELCLSIPATLAEGLGIRENTVLFLEKTISGFSASPFPDEVSLQMHIAEKVMRENRDVLRRLAQS